MPTFTDEKRNSTDLTDSTHISEHELANVQLALDESAIVVTIDKEGIILGVNEQFCNISGYSTEEITDGSTSIFDEAQTSTNIITKIWKQLEDKTVWKGTIHQTSKSGKELRLKLTFIPFFNDNNEINKVVAFGDELFSNVDEKDQLAESYKIFKATFNQMAVGIAHVGLNGEWIRVNERLCDILGYSREELTQLTFQDITHPDDLETDLKYVEQMIANEIENYSMEKRYIRKDKSIIWCKLTVSLITNTDDEPKFFISVVEDVSCAKICRTGNKQS